MSKTAKVNQTDFKRTFHFCEFKSQEEAPRSRKYRKATYKDSEKARQSPALEHTHISCQHVVFSRCRDEGATSTCEEAPSCTLLAHSSFPAGHCSRLWELPHRMTTSVPLSHRNGFLDCKTNEFFGFLFPSFLPSTLKVATFRDSLSFYQVADFGKHTQHALH